MPTVLRSGPYRFFFDAGDRHEPTHVHVERDASKAKFWLEPIAWHSSTGFSRAELNVLYRLIAEHHSATIKHWHDYFDP